MLLVLSFSNVIARAIGPHGTLWRVPPLEVIQSLINPDPVAQLLLSGSGRRQGLPIVVVLPQPHLARARRTP